MIPVMYPDGRRSSLLSTPLRNDRDAESSQPFSMALAPLFSLRDTSAATAVKLGPSKYGSSHITDVAAVSRKGYAPGYKEHNQDSATVMQTYMHRDQSLFGVMDGHGIDGHHVSSFVSRKLPVVLLNHMLEGKATTQAMEEAFVEVDALASSSTSIDIQNSGSTCVVGLLQGRTLTTAWVGDSRAILGTRQPDGQWSVKELSEDHKPDTPAERLRITALGGRVERNRNSRGVAAGPFRVWLRDQDSPGLAMSRAIGDTIARHVGVIAQPDVRVTRLPPGECFLVLASDGVWEYLSNKEVAQLVGGEIDRARAAAQLQLGVLRSAHTGGTAAQGVEAERNTEGATGAGAFKAPWSVNTRRPSPALQACSQLVSESRARWVGEYGGAYIDDITAVCVLLDAAGPPSSKL